MIAIIDYGMGNIYSIRNALENIGSKTKVVTKPHDLKDADAIIIPGVGSFDNTMKGLQPFEEKITNLIEEGILFLGICMGMQALFNKSEEGIGSGFGIIPGKVIRLPDNVLVPQMGWNEIRIRKETMLLEGIENKDFFYFVHSYHCVPENRDVIAATTEHGIDIVSAITRDNISAVQFHPEKSGEKGLRILKNFIGCIKC